MKRTRQALGLTQAELAEILGLNRVTISSYESGKLVPTLRTVLALEALTYRAEKAAQQKEQENERA